MTSSATEQTTTHIERSTCGRPATTPHEILVGPRSVGKSTLLRGLAADLDVEIHDLDDLQTRAAVSDDPELFTSGPAPVLIDEFQKVPAVLDSIKSELNRPLGPGRFVLTGSTRYETLAGGGVHRHPR